jgi:uncharacterized protein Yka (UPF0111/DUF47 family)
MEKLISFLVELSLDASVIHETADKLLSEDKLSQEEVAQLKEAFEVKNEEEQFDDMKARLDEALGVKRE